MTTQTIDTTQISSLQEHIEKGTALPADHLQEIRMLASQLQQQELRVLPIIGAGASHDCGVRLASAIGEDLYNDYMNDPAYENEPRKEVGHDLAEVAQAILNATDQATVVRAIGLQDSTLWPEAPHIPEHFCMHRVLARLAREEMFKEIIGFNYDCAKEAGLLSEGYKDSSTTTAGLNFSDHATGHRRQADPVRAATRRRAHLLQGPRLRPALPPARARRRGECRRDDHHLQKPADTPAR
jgi:hypothetical protein